MTDLGHYKIAGCCIDAGFLCREKMQRVAYKRNHADGYAAHRYHCRSCLDSWDADHTTSTGPEVMTCSNCYGDKITITKLRLWFNCAEGEKS